MLSSGCSSFPRLPCTVWMHHPRSDPGNLPLPGVGGMRGKEGRSCRVEGRSPEQHRFSTT